MKFNNVHVMTAMCTPFTPDNQLDIDNLNRLIDHLIATGTQGILVNGTTGEAPTLTHEEKIALIKATVQHVNGRVPVMAGTGSNNTQATIEFTNEVAQLGVDAALVVVPYYNKPDQRGMIAHFTKVADESKLPIMIYNIPGRTGVQMSVATIAKLAKHDNIIGIKDCTGNVNMAKIVASTPDDFLAYTGEDADALAARAVGAQGVISVASHLFGEEMQKMYAAYSAGNLKTAGNLMQDLTPKMEVLFAYPSPAPVKAALNHIGVTVGGLRLPLVELSDGDQTAVLATLGL